jgi:hypothetical protein
MGRMLFCYILFGPSFFIIQKLCLSSSLKEYKVIVFLCLKVLPETKKESEYTLLKQQRSLFWRN